jgi:hypothetical protein
MNADVEKAVENDWSVALENAGVLRAIAQVDKRFANASCIADQITELCTDHRVMAQALRDQEAEIARLDASESQLIDERDRAQDALQLAHIELGGDGEWTCKMGAAADYPPDSGDLHDDVPALASEVRARAEISEALLRECNAVALKRGDKYGLCDAIDNDGQPYQSAHLAAHLGAKHE